MIFVFHCVRNTEVRFIRSNVKECTQRYFGDFLKHLTFYLAMAIISFNIIVLPSYSL